MKRLAYWLLAVTAFALSNFVTWKVGTGLAEPCATMMAVNRGLTRGTR